MGLFVRRRQVGADEDDFRLERDIFERVKYFDWSLKNGQEW